MFRSHTKTTLPLICISRCELQFDYGLRQKRHVKVQDRPESFVSGGGKTITVTKTTAIKNERTMEAGRVGSGHSPVVHVLFLNASHWQVVHKRLEREIRPKQTYVAVTSVEETWGLR